MRRVTVPAPAGLDRLAVEDVADPGEPDAGEIRVRVHASSLNFHDYAIVAGAMPTAAGRVPMADGAGEVEAVGAGVEEFAVGDAVVSTFFTTWFDGPPTTGEFSQVPGDGIDGFGQQVVVRPATSFTRAPSGWSHAEAATLPTAGVTAWRSLVADGGLSAGQSVLVLGTGGVSIIALQIARAMGAEVIATTSSEEKRRRLEELGAAATIDRTEHSEWGRRVRELTDGRGVDHVVEVGGAGTLPQSLQAVAVGGAIWQIGVLTGVTGEVPTGALLGRQATLHGVAVGSRAHQQQLVRALETTGIRPVIDSSFELAQMAEAFRHQESGRHIGKVVLEH